MPRQNVLSVVKWHNKARRRRPASSNQRGAKKDESVLNQEREGRQKVGKAGIQCRQRVWHKKRETGCHVQMAATRNRRKR